MLFLNKGIAKIKLEEIEDGQVLEVVREDDLAIDYMKVEAAYFYKHCKFPKPREGKIVCSLITDHFYKKSYASCMRI